MSVNKSVRLYSRGFTAVELIAVVCVVFAGVAVVAMGAQPGFGKPGSGKPGKNVPKSPENTKPERTVDEGGGLLPALAKARANARQMKCSVQVRGVGQALMIWAGNNESVYPMASRFDLKDETVKEAGRAKDTTANIMSMMCYNAMITPEIMVCPDEQNDRVGACQNYEYTNPRKAVKPERALWDPALSADFVNGKGHISYAMLQTSGAFVKDKDGRTSPTGRLTMWSDTFSSSEAAVGDRGAEVESATGDAAIAVKLKNPASTTLKIHGPADSWEGNVFFNDNHVSFLTSMSPGQNDRTYTTAAGKKRGDVLHFDEQDDAGKVNTFLGIFTKAGTEPGDFTPIWD